jgi:hypothetical protein
VNANDEIRKKMAGVRPGTEAAFQRRLKRLESAPASYHKRLMLVFCGKGSRKTMMDLFCYECVGFERAAVYECTAWACPLWHRRPQPGGKAHGK